MLVGFLVGVLLLIGLIGLATCSTGSHRSTSDTSKKLEAYTYAQLYIQENYYSDAEFKYSDSTVTLSGSSATVKGKFSHGGIVYRYEVSMTMHDDYATITSCDIN